MILAPSVHPSLSRGVLGGEGRRSPEKRYLEATPVSGAAGRSGGWRHNGRPRDAPGQRTEAARACAHVRTCPRAPRSAQLFTPVCVCLCIYPFLSLGRFLFPSFHFPPYSVCSLTHFHRFPVLRVGVVILFCPPALLSSLCFLSLCLSPSHCFPIFRLSLQPLHPTPQYLFSLSWSSPPAPPPCLFSSLPLSLGPWLRPVPVNCNGERPRDS